MHQLKPAQLSNSGQATGEDNEELERSRLLFASKFKVPTAQEALHKRNEASSSSDSLSGAQKVDYWNNFFVSL